MKKRYWTNAAIAALYKEQGQLNKFDYYALLAAQWAKGRINNYSDNRAKPYSFGVTFTGTKYVVYIDGKEEIVPFNYKDLLPILFDASENIYETTKIVAKTQPNGEVNFEPMDADVANRLNGTEVVDQEGNRVKIKDTGKTIQEGDNTNIVALSTEDLMNVGKMLNTVVEDALRQHGDSVAYTKPKANMGRSNIIIYVYYEKDPDNPGAPSEDRFSFTFADGKVKLLDAGDTYDICPLVKKAGTLYINRDLAKDALLNFINGNDTLEVSTEQQIDEELLLGFRKAAEMYKSNPKDKENIKELLRQARNFDGDTIQQKLKNAMEQYKSSTADEPQIVSPQDDRVIEEPEQLSCCNDEGNLCLDMSLFIRLLEFAHEDAKEDVDLHYAAENLQKVCNEKGCALMEDYETIISNSNNTKKELPTQKRIEELEGQKWGTDEEVWNSSDKCWKQLAISYVTGEYRRDFSEEKCNAMFNQMSPIEKNIVINYLKHARTGRPEDAKRLNELDVDLGEKEREANDDSYQRYLRGEDEAEEYLDVLRRAHNLDMVAGQDLKDAVMDALADICDVAESLDDSVEKYIEHTIPGITVDQFKEAVDNVLNRRY